MAPSSSGGETETPGDHLPRACPSPLEGAPSVHTPAESGAARTQFPQAMETPWSLCTQSSALSALGDTLVLVGRHRPPPGMRDDLEHATQGKWIVRSPSFSPYHRKRKLCVPGVSESRPWASASWVCPGLHTPRVCFEAQGSLLGTTQVIIIGSVLIIYEESLLFQLTW